MNNTPALVIVDAQRCFMPAEEGARLNTPGFGELPVPDGQAVVSPINQLTKAFLQHDLPIATTQDQHPEKTAHFAAAPNFVDTWPPHGRAGTPGGELHPELLAAHDPRVAHFIKGDVEAATPAEDDSYSGVLAHRTDTKTGDLELLPDYLHKHAAFTQYVCGLTIGKERPLCVDSTAMDLQKLDFNVTVVTDAVEAVVPEDKVEILENLGKLGVRLANVKQVLAEIEAIRGGVTA